MPRWDDWQIQVDLGAGFVALATDGQSDLRGAVDVTRGLQGAGYEHRVARIGTLLATLDNRGQKYSPGHANALAGFEVGAACRLLVRLGASWYTVFRGRLDEIRPAYGVWGERATTIRAVDDMDRLDEAVGSLPPMAFVRTGQAIQSIVTAIYTPPGMAIADGQAQLDYVGVDASDSARAAITTLLDSEGYPAAFYLRADGTVVYEDRNTRRSLMSVDWTLGGGDLAGLTVVRRRGDLYRRVVVTMRPIVTNPGFETVGQIDTSTPPTIHPGETRSFNVIYRDPDNTSARMLATNVQNLASPYFVLRDAPSGGNNMVPSCTITHEKGASASTVTIRNNSSTRIAYVQTLAIRAQGVRMYEEQQVTAVTSAAAGGTLELSFGLNSDINEAAALAQSVAAMASTSQPQVTDLFVKGKTASLVEMILRAEIGEVMQVEEEQTGISNLFVINAKRLHLATGGYCEAHFEAEPVSPVMGWLLGVAGRSELGATTYIV